MPGGDERRLDARIARNEYVHCIANHPAPCEINEPLKRIGTTYSVITG